MLLRICLWWSKSEFVIGLPVLDRAQAQQEFGKENVLICGNIWELHEKGKGKGKLYIDDSSINSKSGKEHLEHVERVYQRL